MNPATRFSLPLAVLCFFTLSCEKSPIAPEPETGSISMSLLRNFSVVQTDYDEVLIKSGADLLLPARIVSRVSAGTGLDSHYKERSAAIPSYADVNGKHLLRFEFSMPLDPKLINMQITLRYYYFDGHTVDIDMLLPTYKFPYASAAAYLTSSILSYPGSRFQDIARNQYKFYYHPFGPEGLSELDLATGRSKMLVMYSAGDHIALSGEYVFYDFGHRTVMRYDLASGRTDLEVAYFKDRQSDLRGMATVGEQLYVLASKSGTISLISFDLDGNLKDKIPFPRETYYMAVSEKILFTLDFASAELVRFDLGSKKFVPSLPMPSKNGDGMKIFGNQFYYTDFVKGFVGVIPLSAVGYTTSD